MNNDWDFFTRSEAIRKRIFIVTKPGSLYRGIRQVTLEPAEEAVRSWEPHYYTQDFNNSRQLGLNAFSISLEWARIEPEKGQWNQEAINHYKQMIITMRDINM